MGPNGLPGALGHEGPRGKRGDKGSMVCEFNILYYIKSEYEDWTGSIPSITRRNLELTA